MNRTEAPEERVKKRYDDWKFYFMKSWAAAASESVVLLARAGSEERGNV